MSQVTATFYVQVQPEFYTNGNVYRIKVVGLSQKRPRSPRPGTALVKLRLDVDAEVFRELQATAEVDGRHLQLVPPAALEADRL